MTSSTTPVDHQALMVGISGCSSSGKTTLARLLRDLFPRTFILHEDDFYRAESELPVHPSGHLDWDCPEAINVPQMADALAYIRAHGELPPTLDSKEDQNAIGVVPVRKSVLDELRDRGKSWRANLPRDGGMPKICVIDGFLLYTPALEPVPRHLDLRLFLVVSREKAIRRREARDGYVTLEGFWKDPPGYVEQIVWPNYASSHAWMFESGDAERGVLDTAKLEGKSIRAQTDKGIDVDMEITLDWAVHEVMRAVEGFMCIQK